MVGEQTEWPGKLRRIFYVRPRHAWKFMMQETGGEISRATFYRWLQNGKIDSMRLGKSIFVSRPDRVEGVRRCRAGEKL